MSKRRDFTKPIGTPYKPYSEERVRKLEEITLRGMRSVLNRPDMSVQEMREINSRKPENTIEVTFLKHR